MPPWRSHRIHRACYYYHHSLTKGSRYRYPDLLWLLIVVMMTITGLFFLLLSLFSRSSILLLICSLWPDYARSLAPEKESLFPLVKWCYHYHPPLPGCHLVIVVWSRRNKSTGTKSWNQTRPKPGKRARTPFRIWGAHLSRGASTKTRCLEIDNGARRANRKGQLWGSVLPSSLTGMKRKRKDGAKKLWSP